MKWMDIAWAEVGVEEVDGTAAHPEIVAYFRDAGRPDIVSDEVAWCAAFIGACTARAGIENPLPSGERLLARSYAKFGPQIDDTRVGAIAVLERPGSSWSGHVGFVVGETETHIMLLGGNQSNSVSVAHYPKDRLICCVWPEPERTPKQIEAAGSRTVAAARQSGRDVSKSVGAYAVNETAPEPDTVSGWTDGLADYAGTATKLKSAIEAFADFAVFLAAKLPVIALIMAVYWGLKVVWAQGRITWFRTEDANTGKHTGKKS